MSDSDARRRVVAVLPDLFFAAKVAATAEAAGARLDTVAAGLARERCLEPPTPALVILDLAADATMETARALKADPKTRAIPIVGFYSHVDDATRVAALAAGVDRAMPRSAFSTRLAEILGGH
jgi:CheY-like chemotaxis protein